MKRLKDVLYLGIEPAVKSAWSSHEPSQTLRIRCLLCTEKVATGFANVRFHTYIVARMHVLAYFGLDRDEFARCQPVPSA